MKKNKKVSNEQNLDAPKKKITFPKVMLILAILIAVGLGASMIIDKLNDSVAKSISIEGASSDIYIGNPQYESVEFAVSVYPSTANQGYVVSTSDANIASVSITEDGKVKVTAVGVGKAVISVQSVAKSSLIDSCEINVKNTDVQNVTFIKPATEEDEEDMPITSVAMQKDGIEHYVYFNLSPLDANMDNLSVDFDENILESVSIDKTNKRLVVVPKTDIENASTTVYVEINQNTDEGERVVAKNIRIQINLVEREAYLSFEFASDANREFSSNHSGFVYLDPKLPSDLQNVRDISDFYVKVNIAYDKEFNNLGEFKMEDFVVRANDEVIVAQNSTQNSFTYRQGDTDLLIIDKIYDNGEWYYKVTATKDFRAGKYVRLSFEHFYTGAQGVVEVSHFDQTKLSGDANRFNIKQQVVEESENSKIGHTINLISESNSAYSISKGSETVMFTTYDAAINAKIIKAFPVDENNEECYLFSNGSGEQIAITQVANRMKLSASSNVFNTQNTHEAVKISFQWKYIYWDNRYIVNYGEEQKIDLNFYIESVYFTAGGDNVNAITLSNAGTTININSTLRNKIEDNNYSAYFNQDDVKYDVYQLNSDTGALETSNKLTITIDTDRSIGGFWSFAVSGQGAPTGEYVIKFRYCDMQIVINATLP